MPYYAYKALELYRRLEAVEYKKSLYEEYIEEPRLYEIYDLDMFDAWVKRAEDTKAAIDAVRKTGRGSGGHNRPNIIRQEFIPQSVFSNDFYCYIKEQKINKDFISFLWELVFDKELTASQKRVKLFNKDGMFIGYDNKTEFQKAVDLLNFIFNFPLFVIVYGGVIWQT